jgi:RimJ/RimL family protein N-acetyltransferase
MRGRPRSPRPGATDFDRAIIAARAENPEMAHPWPLFDLRLQTPDLELRLPTDDDLLALVTVARAGLHEPGETVFRVTWDELPSPAFERSFLRYHWSLRGSWAPDEWQLVLAVFRDGTPIGMQEVAATRFPSLRTVNTGSWLGRAWQGRGYGTQMRAAVLALAFEGLGALVAESGYVDGNLASARVSERLGYVANGQHVVAPRGDPIAEHHVRITPDTWRRDLVPVTIEGLEPCLGFFGAVPMPPEAWATP